MENTKVITLSFNVNETEMNIEVFKTNIIGIGDFVNDVGALDNLPGVYLFYDKKNLYIGESWKPFHRLVQHRDSNKLKPEEEILVFRSDKFNKSAIYDIETKLIDFFSATEEWNLENEKKSQGNHNYFLKEKYQNAFDKIWEFIIEEGITKYTVPNIEKLEIYKFSPYKDLNAEQEYALQESVKEDNTRKILIEGYPGTGKSILASKLYSEISKTKNIALVAGTKGVLDSYIKVFNRYQKELKTKSIIAKANRIINEDIIYDVIVVDEAHRLLRQGGKGHPGGFQHLSKGQNELSELSKKCKKLIILYDKNQSVHDADFIFNEKDHIIEKKIYLKEQMRASAGYRFINYIMDFFSGSKDVKYEKTSSYDVKVFSSFKEMYEELKKKSSQYPLTRLLSGYTREWRSKIKKWKEDDPNRPYDFDIDGIKLRWNTKNTKWLDSKEAQDLSEVAYYSTIQGFDLNYAGVIIGKDIYLDDNENIRINEEYVFGSTQKPSKSDPQRHMKMRNWVLNRYKILLSRGSKGVYIYCEDKKLSIKLMKDLNTYN